MIVAWQLVIVACIAGLFGFMGAWLTFRGQTRIAVANEKVANINSDIELIKSLTLRVTALEAELAAANARYIASQEAVASTKFELNGQLLDNKKEMGLTSVTVESLNRKLTDLSDRYTLRKQEYQDDINKLQSENVELRRQLIDLQKEYTDLKEHCNILTDQINSLAASDRSYNVTTNPTDSIPT